MSQQPLSHLDHLREYLLENYETHHPNAPSNRNPPPQPAHQSPSGETSTSAPGTRSTARSSSTTRPHAPHTEGNREREAAGKPSNEDGTSPERLNPTTKRQKQNHHPKIPQPHHQATPCSPRPPTKVTPTRAPRPAPRSTTDHPSTRKAQPPNRNPPTSPSQHRRRPSQDAALRTHQQTLADLCGQIRNNLPASIDTLLAALPPPTHPSGVQTGPDRRPLQDQPLSATHNITTSTSILHLRPESPTRSGPHRPSTTHTTNSQHNLHATHDQTPYLHRWTAPHNGLETSHIREIEAQVDNFTLAAATPTASNGAALHYQYCHLRDRINDLFAILGNNCARTEYLSQQPIPHDDDWPFPQYITTADEPSRSYLDLVILTALGARLQATHRILERANDRAIATHHDTMAPQPQN
jgi:hypothetical protein